MIDQVVLQVHFAEARQAEQLPDVGELVGVEVHKLQLFSWDFLEESCAAQLVMG